MRIAIVGSRIVTKRGFDKIVAYVCALPGDTILVSGGAKGADSIAERTARKLGLSVEVHRPTDPSIKYHYLIRNREIVDRSDRVVAFWDGSSSGTAHVINYAHEVNKPLEVHSI